MGFDIAEMEANTRSSGWTSGCARTGSTTGSPWFPNYKSVVFYHIPTFEENGYESRDL